MISQNPNDTFRVLKLTRSEVTYLINTENTAEFYVFPDRVEQASIEDRLYKRKEFTVQGRFLEMKPEEKEQQQPVKPKAAYESKSIMININKQTTYTTILNSNDLRESLYRNIRAIKGFHKIAASYTVDARSS